MKRALIGCGLLSAAACATVLGFRPPEDLPFEHRAHVVEGINCVECHTSIERSNRRTPLAFPTNASCLDCHPEPHDPRACDNCHGSRDVRTHAAQTKQYLAFDHRSHLDVVKGNCVRCHVGVADDASSLAAPMASCLACHDHEQEFRERRCDACHIDLPSETTRPLSHAPHDSDFASRHGTHATSARDLCSTCHSESQCAQCHGVSVPALDARLAFDRPTLTGLHRAGFVSRHSLDAAVDPGLCVTCHSEQSCASCHLARGVAGERGAVASPHPAGWVGLRAQQNSHGPAARRDPLSCAACHGGAGEMLCVECHQVGGIGGNPHPPAFNSTRDLRRDRPCRLCHLPSTR